MTNQIDSASTGPLVVTLAYDGLCTFEFGVAVEVFGLPRPEMGPDWYRFAVASLEGGELRATGGIRLVADGGLELLERADTIIIPGWRDVDEPGSPQLLTALRHAYARGARIVSICVGAFVIAQAGLLDGKAATTHWRYTEALQERYPSIEVRPSVLYVDEGQVMTSAGSAAGLDLCLHMVRKDYGLDAVNRVARRLVIPPHRDGGQAQFVERPVPRPHESARISSLIDRVRADIGPDYTVAWMAELVGMSPRTFIRRFEAATGSTPARWLLEERLSCAKQLLEGTALSVNEIALTAGFGSAATLRHHFRTVLHTTPLAYRSRFAAPERLAS